MTDLSLLCRCFETKLKLLIAWILVVYIIKKNDLSRSVPCLDWAWFILIVMHLIFWLGLSGLVPIQKEWCSLLFFFRTAIACDWHCFIGGDSKSPPIQKQKWSRSRCSCAELSPLRYPGGRRRQTYTDYKGAGKDDIIWEQVWTFTGVFNPIGHNFFFLNSKTIKYQVVDSLRCCPQKWKQKHAWRTHSRITSKVKPIFFLHILQENA